MLLFKHDYSRAHWSINCDTTSIEMLIWSESISWPPWKPTSHVRHTRPERATFATVELEKKSATRQLRRKNATSVENTTKPNQCGARRSEIAIPETGPVGNTKTVTDICVCPYARRFCASRSGGHGHSFSKQSCRTECMFFIYLHNSALIRPLEDLLP